MIDFFVSPHRRAPHRSQLDSPYDQRAVQWPARQFIQKLQSFDRRGLYAAHPRKADVPSWGELDKASGQIIGLEPDLAHDLAKRMGVALTLVPVQSAERIAVLDMRQVDVVIANLSQTPERRAKLTLVAPSYYASGTGLLARRSAGFKQWSDLRNRRICSRRGSFYNRAIAVEYGADIVALYSAETSLAALRDGRCDGFLGDSTVLSVVLRDPELAQRYEMILPILYPSGWAVALHREERGGRLEALISHAVSDWHRSGLLSRLEDKWDVPRSALSNHSDTISPETTPTVEGK